MAANRANAFGDWYTESQLDASLLGLSVALLDRRGRCRGAVRSTMPLGAYRDNEHILQIFLPPLQEAAQAIRRLL